jgi:hypothetical protein
VHPTTGLAVLASANTFTTAQVIDTATDVVPLTLIGHSTQTASYLTVRNDANTRTYLAMTPEVIHNQNAIYFQAWGTGTTTGLTGGFRADFNLVPASATATSQYNIVLTNVADTVAQNWTNDIGGLIGQVIWRGTGTHTVGYITGLKGTIDFSNASAGLVATANSVTASYNVVSSVTTGSMFRAQTPSGAGTVTNMYGVYIEPVNKGGTYSVGARIDTPTGTGSTLKTSLWLGADAAGTTAAGGIVFGSGADCNLYRTAPFFVELATDNIFSASSGAVKIGSVGPSLESGINLNGPRFYRTSSTAAIFNGTLNVDTALQENSVLVLKQMVIPFSKSGTLTTYTGVNRMYIDGGNWTIIAVRASVNTAPTGATILVDVNKNGTTIFTTQSNRPTIAISGFTALAAAINVNTLTTGDYLTVDIDQVGSTVAGADLTVTVWLQRA